MLRPGPPALRDARNSKQSLHLSSIVRVNSKYVSNRQIMIRPFDDSDLISSAEDALSNDAQVCARSQRFGKTAHKPLIIHPNSKPPARNPWFRYFKHGGADRPTLADERVVHPDSFGREIFPKLAVLKGPTELLFPPTHVFYGVGIYRFIGPPMRFTIGLIVSFEIDASGGNAAGHRRFPNGALGRAAIVIKLPRAPNIHR